MFLSFFSNQLNRKIHHIQQQPHQNGHAPRGRMVKRINDAVEYVVEESKRVVQDVPAVPAQVAAQVNAEAGQKQEQDRQGGNQAVADVLFEQSFDVHQADEAVHQARPCKGQDDDQVEPDGRGIPHPQMEQIGQDIRRIGKKQQPRGDEYG